MQERITYPRLFFLLAMVAALTGNVACSTAPVANKKAASIDKSRLVSHIRILSSDKFGGRAPASAGEQLTVEYLTGQFQKMGLRPGANGSYVQNVPLISIEALGEPGLHVRGAGGDLNLAYATETMLWTKRVSSRVAVTDSEIVFVGYGIVAPEFEWNDYAGIDVRGKTVVMLVNDPGFATQNPAFFKGNAMTYYGRWTYKFEEAAKQGAAAALIVHENKAAGYPWDVVRGSWAGAQFDLVTSDRNMSRVAIEGWISSDAAARMFQLAGAEFTALRASASSREFRPSSLGLTVTTSFSNVLTESSSQNVIAVLPGLDESEENIIYTAHWDHLGAKKGEDGEDTIYNGAVDNATGVAGILEIATVAASQPAAERTRVFVAFTAEEAGLLGSAWYASHPLFPVEKTVAVINIDALQPLGPAHDLTVIGFGNSELDDWLQRVAAGSDRRLSPESTPEKGFFYRSDHFNLAKLGVPGIYIKSGLDHREMSQAEAQNAATDYVQNRYHKVNDAYTDDWDVRGIVEDIQLLHDVGAELANSGEWPNWRAGNEFRALRDRSAAARQ